MSSGGFGAPSSVRSLRESLRGATLHADFLGGHVAARGDTLVLWKMDRAGRNTRGVLELVEDLTRRGVGLRSITEEIDTFGPMGKAILTVMLAFGTLERDVLIERTRAGFDAARARGRVGGRPTVVSLDKLKAARALIRSGATVTAAAEAVSVSRSSLYRGLARTDGPLPKVGSD